MTMETAGRGATGEGNAERTPSERRLSELLETLLRRTREEALSWEIDDGHPDSYCVSGDGWLIATRSVDGDGVAPYALLVAEPSGTPVLELRSTSPFGRSFGELFAALHAAAAATATMSGTLPLLGRIVTGLTEADGSVPSSVQRSGD